jgi:hypothetical protein
MATFFDLPFVAPVPQGHDVLVVHFHQGEPTRLEALVLDRTDRVLYCGDRLWGPLGNDPALALHDPVAVLTRFTWRTGQTVSGVSGGAIVSVKTSGDANESRTRLFVEPGAGAPYR